MLTKISIIFQAVGEYTRTAPVKRIEALMRFSKRMCTTKAVQDELSGWDIKMEPQLQRMTGRTLVPEEILQVRFIIYLVLGFQTVIFCSSNGLPK